MLHSSLDIWMWRVWHDLTGWPSGPFSLHQIKCTIQVISFHTWSKQMENLWRELQGDSGWGSHFHKERASRGRGTHVWGVTHHLLKGGPRGMKAALWRVHILTSRETWVSLTRVILGLQQSSHVPIFLFFFSSISWQMLSLAFQFLTKVLLYQ